MLPPNGTGGPVGPGRVRPRRMAPVRTAQDRTVGQSRSPLDVAGLELLATRGWRGGDEAPLGDWLLRAGGGFTGRANSALVVGDPGMPLPDAVDAVPRWYTDRDLRPCAMLPGRQSRAADAAFAAAGRAQLGRAHA